jgi:hypothetical protein
VFFNGDFEVGDGERFTNRIVDIEEAIIIFNSRGGNLLAGLEVGRAIRLKGFSTLVPSYNVCASSCAFAWLGGRVRYMASDDSIGFHAAYEQTNQGPYERGAPNALVGAYLNWLGLTSRAIVLITLAPPDSMTWLSFDLAAEVGVDVRRWGGRGSSSRADPDLSDLDAPLTNGPKSDKRPDRMTNGGEQLQTAPPPGDTRVGIPETAEIAPAEPPPARAPPAQRAIYYYQGPEGSRGQQAEGTVQWAEISRDGRPAVEATLRLAEQNVTATVTITRNDDATLPASHLVEVMFTGSLAPSPVQRVPALVLKQTEQARGEPLIGAAVMVTPELFWIALSDEADQVGRNLQLLRDGSWFDIPILFDDGTRALLTFEKGIPGDKVFETVLAEWQGEGG